MVVATVAALIWANSPVSHSYRAAVGHAALAQARGSAVISASLRMWVNQGLMTLFFLVVGLEAKRQLDLGELRDRRRVAIPAMAALGGIAVPAAIYLAWNAGSPSAHGWGAAISTDTAFALGAVGLLAPRSATRMRVFLLSLAVVDDLAGLLVLSIAYTASVNVVALAVAVVLYRAAALAALAAGAAPSCRDRARHRDLVGDVRIGHRPGDLGSRHRARDQRLPAVARRGGGRRSSSHARSVSSRRRSLRAPPSAACASSISPNERLQYELHPWTSYLIVPLFALANAGVHLSGSLLSDALHLTDHARHPHRLCRRQADRRGQPARGSPRARSCADRARRSARRCCWRAAHSPASASRSRC